MFQVFHLKCLTLVCFKSGKELIGEHTGTASLTLISVASLPPPLLLLLSFFGSAAHFTFQFSF